MKLRVLWMVCLALSKVGFIAAGRRTMATGASASVVVTKFCRSHSMHILLRELLHAVEGILQLLLVAFEVFVTRIGWNDDEFAETHQHTRKRFRNDEAVPGVEDPGAV